QRCFPVGQSDCPCIQNFACFGINPIDLVRTGGQIQSQRDRSVSTEVHGISTARLDEGTGSRFASGDALDNSEIRFQLDEIETVNEILEDRELLADFCAAAAGCLGVRRAVFLAACKGIIEVAEDGTAGKQKLPRLDSVRAWLVSLETGFV